MFEEVKGLLLSTILQDNTKGRTRKIIFWYDPKGEYSDFIDEFNINDTEIIKYDNNAFWIRYHIEKEELDKNILIYLPMDRKKGLENDLLDLETANPQFFNPDATTMRMKNLGLSDECRSIIKRYDKYFKDKKREQKFYEFEIDHKDPSNIDLIVTSCLLNIKSISIDDILKNIIIAYYDDKKKLEDLFKYGDTDFICQIINDYFGSNINGIEDLEVLFKSLIFSYFVSELLNISSESQEEVNKYGKYILKKKNNIHVFVDNMMRDSACRKHFENISKMVEKEFGIKELIDKMDIDTYKTSDAFITIDHNIIEHLCDTLLSGVTRFNEYTELLNLRESKYWFDKLENEYNAIEIAIKFFEQIPNVMLTIKTIDIDKFADLYANRLSDIDTLYRKFYFYYDKVDTDEYFKKLKEKIENIYINDFISNLSIKWSESIEMLTKYDTNKMTMQNTFYHNYVKPYDEKKNRIIVLISDAFRYECAKELTGRLIELGAKANIDYMLGLVPSYTKLGMASLLPNTKLERIESSDDILVDGMKSSSIKDREVILQKENPDSIVFKYADLYEMTKAEWKKVFSGKKIVYIYHDVIDNTGEHNENKVFDACNIAIDELSKLIRDLHTTFSGIDLFVTADHGFFYKRSKLEDYDKAIKDTNITKQKTRYSYSKNKMDEGGIISINLNYLFGGQAGYVNIPKGNMIFSHQGGNFNYVHGGILPQEIIIPVINFKSTRTIEEAKKVGITYSGLSSKITNAITYLDFVQDSNVDENNKPCRYLLHFEDEFKNRVSNECTIIANYENKDVKDRFFKEKFVFKNINYDRNKVYYLVITDEATGIEASRVKFYIDIAITNNFEF